LEMRGVKNRVSHGISPVALYLYAVAWYVKCNVPAASPSTTLATCPA
jgi:hypothetical protein